MGRILRFPRAKTDSNITPSRLVPAQSLEPGPAAVGVEGKLYFGEIEKTSDGKVKFRRNGKRYTLKDAEVDIFRILAMIVCLPLTLF